MASLGMFLQEEPHHEDLVFQEPDTMSGLEEPAQSPGMPDLQTAANHFEDMAMSTPEAATSSDLRKEARTSRRRSQYTSSNAIRAQRVRRYSLMALETEEEEKPEEEVDN